MKPINELSRINVADNNLKIINARIAELSKKIKEEK